MAQDFDKEGNVLYKGHGFSLEQSNDFVRWLQNLRDREGRCAS